MKIVAAQYLREAGAALTEIELNESVLLSKNRREHIQLNNPEEK